MAMGQAGPIEVQLSCPEEVGKDFDATLKSFTLELRAGKAETGAKKCRTK